MGTLRRPRAGELEEFGSQIPMDIANEQGVSLGERFTLKNLASNPAAAKEYLSIQGYEVRDLPQPRRKFLKWNFAVRRAPDQMWKVVDPDGFEPEDILDLVGHAIVGIPASIGAAVGAPLGIAGVAGGGAVGAAAGEAGRQAIGTAVGVPNNVSGTNIAAAGIGGAAGPVVAKGLGLALRGAGFVGRGLAAKIAGAKPIKALDIDSVEAFIQRALDRGASGKLTRLRDRLPSVTDMARRMNQQLLKLRRADGGRFEEKVLAESIEQEAQQAGTFVDIEGAIARNLRNVLPEEDLAEAGLLKGQMERVEGLVVDVLGGTSEKRVPVAVAVKLKQALQALGRKRDVFEGQAPGELFKRRVKGAAAEVKNAIEDKLGHVSRSTSDGRSMSYTELMQTVKNKLDWLNSFEANIRAVLGKAKKPGTEQKQIERIANVIKSMAGTDSKEGFWQFFNDFEDFFQIPVGQRFTTDLKRALVGLSVGDQGRMSAFPQFTATGGILGASLATGGGFIAGGLPGALAGGAAATPRSLALLTRVGLLGGQAARDIAASPAGAVITTAQRQAFLHAVRQSAVEPSGRATLRPLPRRRRPQVIR